MGRFFIDTDSGQIATERQLLEAGVAPSGEDPPRPWWPINAPVDASTLWYAAMRRKEKGIFIGSLVFRHTPHHTLLLERGWEEVPVEQIGVEGATTGISEQPDLGGL